MVSIQFLVKSSTTTFSITFLVPSGNFNKKTDGHFSDPDFGSWDLGRILPLVSVALDQAHLDKEPELPKSQGETSWVRDGV